MTQQGTSVTSQQGDINYNVGGNLDIIASKDTGHSSTTTKSGTTSVSAGSAGAAASTNFSKSSNSKSFIAYNNSISVAEQGSINFNVGGDMKGSGHNALAQDIKTDVGGALTLESLQDEYYAKNSSSNFVFSGANAGGSNSFGGNIGESKGNTDSAWVNNQTSLIATNSVEVNADTIHLKGSTIANTTHKVNLMQILQNKIDIPCGPFHLNGSTKDLNRKSICAAIKKKNTHKNHYWHKKSQYYNNKQQCANIGIK